MIKVLLETATELHPFVPGPAALGKHALIIFPGAVNQPSAIKQGQDTDPDAVAEIRDAVRNGSEASVRLLNYKKSGKPFWNMFTLAPMADVDGNLRFIIGVQVHC
jgi:PAS domain